MTKREKENLSKILQDVAWHIAFINQIFPDIDLHESEDLVLRMIDELYP